jgi:hypothetical protein
MPHSLVLTLCAIAVISAALVPAVRKLQRWLDSPPAANYDDRMSVPISPTIPAPRNS